MDVEELIKPFRITDGSRFRLTDIDPDDTRGSKLKDQSDELLAQEVQQLSKLQDMLYAQDRWSVLLIFQAMDAAGKDGVIKHVMSGVNPQGCQVVSFKVPSDEELDHDYMWRALRQLPERGRIGIFNRSYYEEALVVRVHPGILAKQKLPRKLVTDDIWKERFEDMKAAERYLSRNGTVIRKFFLHVSKKEQKKRFLARMDDPEKNWKFSAGDVSERQRWDDYMAAYEDVIRNTSAPHAPWFAVPSDKKWFSRLVVAAAVIDALQGLDLHYPEIDEPQRKELAQAREVLMHEP
jgi:PPK2 family polyphosphate:nucleotide phosphotransferase